MMQDMDKAGTGKIDFTEFLDLMTAKMVRDAPLTGQEMKPFYVIRF